MAAELGIAVMAAGAVASAGAGIFFLKKLAPSAQRIRRRVSHERVRVRIAGGRLNSEQALTSALALGAGVALYTLTAMLSHQTGVSLAAALGGFMVPKWVREWRETNRLLKLSDQLGRVMGMISTSLRRGIPLEMAVSESANAVPAPLGPVLRNLADATVMGVTLSQAVEQIRSLPAVRGSSDFSVFATEMVVCHQRGANVIVAFESLRNVLEARRKYRAQVQEYMGQHLIQSLVIGGIGLGVLALYAWMSPDGLKPLLESITGQLILAASLLGNMFVIRLTHLSLLNQTRRV